MAAGLGFKTFNNGDVLPASDVNGYLMQGVWVFANAAARTSAVTSPQEGNVSFLKDTNSLEIYDGAAWVAYGSGDITGITTAVDSGLTGGATSGTADIKLNTSAKGDLLVGTGSGTSDKLTVGTNNYVLTADSSTTTGLKWASVASQKFGQILQAVKTDTFTTTSTSYVDITGLSVTITPTSASSTIWILMNVNGATNDATSGSIGGLRLLRGATAIAIGDTASNRTRATGSISSRETGSTNIQWNNAATFIDSPATTSATTYKIQGIVGGGTLFINRSESDSDVASQYRTISSITAIEVLP